MSGFEVSCLSCGYGKREVIKDVSFNVERGRVVGLIGANGSGKTTLIKAIASILPHNGKCFFDGITLEDMSISRLSKICSYIPQRSGISIDISALDIVVMGLNPHLGIFEQPSAEMIERSRAALSLVGLEIEAETNYMKLSEGQKALCIMARALVSKPSLLLMDEPESALDFSVRHKALSIIKERARKDGACVLVSLHDPNLALCYCDELLLLKDGSIVDRVVLQGLSEETIEKKLSVIYGSIRIVGIPTSTGKKVLTMIKEDDE